VLLAPFFAALLLLWRWLEPACGRPYLVGGLLIGGSAALLIFLPYLWLTAHYPPERQVRDAHVVLFEYAGGPLGRTGAATVDEDMAALASDRLRDLRVCARRLAEAHFAHLPRCPAELVIFLADAPIIRALGAYLLGLLLTLWRASAGDVTYFLGGVSASGWWSYFPVVYAIKEPLSFHLLTAVALLRAIAGGRSQFWRRQGLKAWLRCHPAEVLMLGWIVLYWGITLQANLQIGVRHLLPVFPFTMILVGRTIGRWVDPLPDTAAQPRAQSLGRSTVVAVVLLWQLVSVLRVYPSFLAYFHEAVGGPAGGSRYIGDSNLDWGQDLRRLRAFVDTHHMVPIAVDYFGGGSLTYELGAKAMPWRSAKGPPPGWLAVSATVLQLAQGHWHPALGWQPADAYEWLQGHVPVATIGYSIWVFDLRRPREEKSDGENVEGSSPVRLSWPP
jgi:hypothetical protein